MCGIGGFSVPKEKEVSAQQFTNFKNTLIHRGPDYEGYLVASANGKIFDSRENILDPKTKLTESVFNTRLSIIDIEQGDQPFFSEDKRYCVVFNGEIYNYIDLRKDLVDWDFKTNSDTEVIIPLFLRYGTEFVSKLNGMFSICIYDIQEKTFYLFRDQIGIKPLYYYFDGVSFAFSSEIKSFMELPFFKKEINYNAIYDYLTFQNIYGNKTLFKNVNLLENGEILQYKNKKLKVNKYWSYNDMGINTKFDKEEFDLLLEQSIKSNLISDAKLGGYQSSGLDTTIVTSIASKFDKNYNTVTCGFNSSGDNPKIGVDESAKAKEISNYFGVENHNFKIKDNFLEDYLYKTIYHLDEPRMGYSYQNLLISEKSSTINKVMLSGVGSDELFGGYPWRYDFKNKNKLDKSKHFEIWNRVINIKEKEEAYVYSNEIKENYSPFESYIEVLDKSKQSSPISTIFAFEFNTFLQGLLIVEDKLSMANSIESRVPFLDINLVNYVTKLNPEIKFTKNNGKKILNEYISRTHKGLNYEANKVGFIPYIGSWVEPNNLTYIKNLLNESSISKHGILKFEYVDNILKNFFNGDFNLSRQLWSIISLQVWLNIFFDDNIELEGLV